MIFVAERANLSDDLIIVRSHMACLDTPHQMAFNREERKKKHKIKIETNKTTKISSRTIVWCHVADHLCICNASYNSRMHAHLPAVSNDAGDGSLRHLNPDFTLNGTL